MHGLQGHATKTWTTSSLCWPKDLLPQDLPFARIITFGYHPLSTFEPRPQIRDLAKMLLDSLASNRRLRRAVTRPLIFIAHSLGGLIVKEVQNSSCITHHSGTDVDRLFSFHKLYNRWIKIPSWSHWQQRHASSLARLISKRVKVPGHKSDRKSFGRW